MSYTWSAIIKTQWGDVRVTVDAPNQHIARNLIESKYGKGSILGNYVNKE